MGCGASSEAGVRAQRDRANDEGVEVEDSNVPITEEGYPEPKPPSNKKDDVYNPEKYLEIEKNAQDTPDILLDSYEALVAHLTRDAWNELGRLRAIFVWMGTQKISEGKQPNPNANSIESPRAYLQLVRNKRGSYSSMFALMCRKAKLPCVIIKGLAKSASYEVGDTDLNGLKNSWVSVYVDGNWRFIHPLWAFLALVGHKTGNWTLVETGGMKTDEKEEKSEGKLSFQVNEFWFLTDPEKMFISCFPDDPKWQLLVTPRSLDDFAEVPYLRKSFHSLRLKLTGEQKCRLNADKGKVEIPIEIPKELAGKIKLTYDLFFRHSCQSEATVDNVHLDRYVFMNNRKQEVVFAIRFPTVGIFKITVFGNDVSVEANSLEWLCDFRIDCSAALKDCQPLPDCPDIGWGPGVEADYAGLEPITHDEGLIRMKKKETLSIKFKLNRPTELKAEMLHNKLLKSDLQQYVDTFVTKKEATINIRPLPEGGEYALKLHFRQAAVSGKEFYNVVNYLVQAPGEPVRAMPPNEPPKVIAKTKSPKREVGFHKNMRTALQQATEGSDLTELENAITAFEKNKLEDNGDLTKAKDTLKLLQLKKDLLDAMMRRHVDVLDVAIQNAQNSHHRDKLVKPLRDAEKMRDHLRSMDKSRHPILKLNQRTISELASYKQPLPIIHSVMTAAFLLLGEKEQNLASWPYIQALLRKTGQYSVKRRILNFDTKNLMEDTSKKAHKYLSRHDMDEARDTSAGVGTFYKWASSVLENSNFDKERPTENGEQNHSGSA